MAVVEITTKPSLKKNFALQIAGQVTSQNSVRDFCDFEIT